MQKATKTFSRFFESNHESGAVELFICEIQEGDDAGRWQRSASTRESIVDDNLPLSEVHVLGVFSVNVQGLGLLWKVEDDAVKYGA